MRNNKIALSDPLFPDGPSFTARVTALLSNKSEAQDLISQVHDLIGPEKLSADELAAGFHVQDEERQTLYITPSLKRDRPIQSPAGNLMRYWLVDYLVTKSQELSDAPNGVQWSFYLHDANKGASEGSGTDTGTDLGAGAGTSTTTGKANSKAKEKSKSKAKGKSKGTDESQAKCDVELLFLPESVRRKRCGYSAAVRPASEVACQEFERLSFDKAFNNMLSFHDLKAASARSDSACVNEALAQSMSASELQSYLRKLRSTRYTVYCYCPAKGSKNNLKLYRQLKKYGAAAFLQGLGFPLFSIGLVNKVEFYSDMSYLADKIDYFNATTSSSIIGSVFAKEFEKPKENLYKKYRERYQSEDDDEWDEWAVDEYEEDYYRYNKVETDQITPFQVFFGSSLFVPELCKKMGFDAVFTPDSFLNRAFCYDHTYATNSHGGGGTIKMPLAKIERTATAEALIAHYKFRTDVIYGESRCLPLLFNFYIPNLVAFVKSGGQNSASAPDGDPMALLQHAGATAGFCAFPIETIRKNFRKKSDAEAATPEAKAKAKVKAAAAAAKAAEKAAKAAKKQVTVRKSESDRLLLAAEELLFRNDEQHAAYGRSVAATAKSIGQYISKECGGEVRYIGFARSLKYLYVDFLIFDSEAFKAAIVGLQDSAFAKKHGLSSCSFQTFSRYAPIHTFYGKAPKLDATPEF